MKYLITGCKGQLGYDIARELEKRGQTDYLALDVNDMDITDKEQVMKMVTEYTPDVIFHCAAWTRVDDAEDTAKEICEKVNVIGTRNMVDASLAVDAKIIYISTDYVFDGTKDGMYEPEDKPTPMSVYGTTKYLGEEEAKRNPKHYIARITWAFGINGNNFIKTMLKLSETKEELNIVGDQYGSPTYTVDLSRVLVDMANTDKYGIYHCNNEEFCSCYEFANYIFESNNITIKVNSITSEEYPQKAYRPKNSRFNKEKLEKNGFTKMPTWKDAVDRYCTELRETGFFTDK